MEKFYRQWGYYSVIYKTEDTLVKLLYIDKNKSTHLQLHHHRSETWKVISGNVIAIKGDTIYNLNADSEILYINVEEIHKLTAVTDCVILEVQHGDLISEEDIVHLDEQGISYRVF